MTTKKNLSGASVVAVVMALLCVAGWAAADVGPTLSGARVDITSHQLQVERTTIELEMVPLPGRVELTGKQGGEDIATAVVIPDMGIGGTYHAEGTTVGYQDDYDEACPSGATVPDVVYSYSPAGDQAVDILLCESTYMTKLFVYDGDETTLLDCNTFGDPTCDGAPPRSALTDLYMLAGHTYYVVIDGYAGESGDYVLDMEARALVVPSAQHPAIASAPCYGMFNGATMFGYDYQTHADTLVYWWGCESQLGDCMDDPVAFPEGFRHPSVDYYGFDTLFYGLAVSDGYGAALNYVIMTHPLHPEDWVHFMYWSSIEWWDVKSPEIVCDDYYVDELDGEGFPLRPSVDVCVASRAGWTDVPLINQFGTAGKWFELSGCNKAAVDIDDTAPKFTAVFDFYDADSAAWGLFVYEDMFGDFEEDSAHAAVCFVRDEYPTLQHLRNPSVARHDGQTVIVAEYYDEARGDRDLVCLYGSDIEALQMTPVAGGSDLDELFPDVAWDPDGFYTCIFFHDNGIWGLEFDDGAEWSAPCPYWWDPGYLHLDPKPLDLSSNACFLALSYRQYESEDSGAAVAFDEWSYLWTCCDLRGDINGDGEIDIKDIVELVKIMFKSLWPPTNPCEEELDVNDDGAMDIADLVYLVNYMFKQGPPPPPCPPGCGW